MYAVPLSTLCCSLLPRVVGLLRPLLRCAPFCAPFSFGAVSACRAQASAAPSAWRWSKSPIDHAAWKRTLAEMNQQVILTTTPLLRERERDRPRVVYI